MVEIAKKMVEIAKNGGNCKKMVEIAKNGGNLRKKSNTFLLKFDEQSPAPQIVTYQQMQNNFWFVDVLERCLSVKSAQNILTIFCHRSTALLVSKYGCLFWHARTCTFHIHQISQQRQFWEITNDSLTKDIALVFPIILYFLSCYFCFRLSVVVRSSKADMCCYVLRFE